MAPSLDSSLDLPFKAKRKVTLKAFKTSEKLKYIDNPMVAEETRLTTLRDESLIARGKSTPETKDQIKKAVEAEKKRPKRKVKLGKKPKKRARLWISED